MLGHNKFVASILLSAVLVSCAGYHEPPGQAQRNRVSGYLHGTKDDVSPEIEKALREGKIRTGMNKQQVRLIMDAPAKINRSAGLEQWVYYRYCLGARPGQLIQPLTYLLFDKDGILVDWSDLSCI